MPLATQNGSLIVKNGSVAENCNCCGGWYCYAECPCSYADLMPNTLSATLKFTLPGPIYGAATGNFIAATQQCTRLTPEQASSINGTYTLSKIGTCTYRVSSGGIVIQVTVGSRVNCSLGYTTLSLDQLSFSVPALSTGFSASDSYNGPVNSQCAGIPNYLINAASRSYSDAVTLLCPLSPSINYCPNGGPFPYYSRMLGLGSVSGGRDNPQCSSPLITTIDHSWAIDILYTDTSGAAPTLGTASRVVTLNVKP